MDLQLCHVFFFKDDTFSLKYRWFFWTDQNSDQQGWFYTKNSKNQRFGCYGHRDTLWYVCMHFVLYVYLYIYDIYIYVYDKICIYYLYVDYVVVLWYVHMIIYIYIGASSHGSQVITIASRLGWRSPWLFASENIWNIWNNHCLFMVKPSINLKSKKSIISRGSNGWTIFDANIQSQYSPWLSAIIGHLLPVVLHFVQHPVQCRFVVRDPGRKHLREAPWNSQRICLNTRGYPIPLIVGYIWLYYPLVN